MPKTYQEQVRMIREGFIAALQHPDQGPLLVAALSDALVDTETGGMTTEERAILDELNENAVRQDEGLPPYVPLTLSSASTLLTNAHHLGSLLLTASGVAGTARTATIRTQANFAWNDYVIFSMKTRTGPFRLIAQTGVSLNGNASITVECPGGASAISVERRGVNDWLVNGDFTVV
jgi:hypothetical protein